MKFAAETHHARSMGNEYNPDSQGRFPWDTSVTLSQAALGRLAFFAHMHGGSLSSTFALGNPPSVSAARGYTVFARVWLRPEKVSLVEGDARVTIKAPPMVGV